MYRVEFYCPRSGKNYWQPLTGFLWMPQTFPNQQAAEAKAKGLDSPAASSATSGTETLPEAAADYPAGDGPVVTPVAEAIPRLDASNGESVAPATESKSESSPSETPPAHDQQQPA